MVLKWADPSGLLTCVSAGHLKYSAATVRSQTRAHASVYHFKQLGHTTNGKRVF